MSIEAHPNLHAVLLTVEISKIVFGERRVPHESEVLVAYANALRGRARAEYDIGIVEMIDSLRTLLPEGFRQLHEGREREGTESLKTCVTSFICEVSSRLDDVVERQCLPAE